MNTSTMPAVAIGCTRGPTKVESASKGCGGGSWISTGIGFAGWSAAWSALPAPGALPGGRSVILSISRLKSRSRSAVRSMTPPPGAAAATSRALARRLAS